MGWSQVSHAAVGGWRQIGGAACAAATKIGSLAERRSFGLRWTWPRLEPRLSPKGGHCRRTDAAAGHRVTQRHCRGRHGPVELAPTTLTVNTSRHETPRVRTQYLRRAR